VAVLESSERQRRVERMTAMRKDGGSSEQRQRTAGSRQRRAVSTASVLGEGGKGRGLAEDKAHGQGGMSQNGRAADGPLG
jgi:hypothetical protein